ncbi:FK506-binding protein 5-like [Phoenix dactylifera]|uniref:FK506-binding protein 5-like n=1 Tax=Phoenix dactylifera TaxID=42345 RepID=A0A8B9AXI6_PHODC|nr:FK506-binding protein 5-like [Phoenix dactylifera]
MGRKHNKTEVEEVVEEEKDEVSEAEEEEEEEGVKEEGAGNGEVAAEAEDERRNEEAVELMAGMFVVGKVGKALLAIFDSPITKAGRLHAVYVKTDKGVLFEIKPYVRIPRTLKWLFGLMFSLKIEYNCCW